MLWTVLAAEVFRCQIEGPHLSRSMERLGGQRGRADWCCAASAGDSKPRPNLHPGLEPRRTHILPRREGGGLDRVQG